MEENINKKKLIKHTLFVYLLLLVLLLPNVVRYGLFFDGLVYSSIARNLAEGIGSFWFPRYTDTIYKSFHEALPLQFWLQSLFFKLFGDKIWIEKLYGVISILLTIYFFSLLILELSKLFKLDIEYKEVSWILFLFIITPLVIYVPVNNLLENTLTLFVILTVYSEIKSFNSVKGCLWAFLSGIFLICAFLSKSIVGLFPIITIPLAGILTKQRKWMKLFIYQIIAFSLFIIYLMINCEAYNSIKNHFKYQVIAAIKGERGEKVSNRFTTLKFLFQELLPAFTVAFLLSIKQIKKIKLTKGVIFLILIGLSGSLPYLLTLKQMRRYIYPALPFLCGGIGILSYNSIKWIFSSWIYKKISKYFNYLFVILLPLSIILFYGKIHKNEKYWKETLPVWRKLKKMKRIIVYPCGFKPSWEEYAFYQRYFQWSFGNNTRYIMVRNEENCNLKLYKLKLLIDGPIKLYAKF